MNDPTSHSGPRSFLDDISTCWPEINNPVQFVMRYAPAIRRYLQAILKDSDAADEASQDFLVRVFDRGFQFEGQLTGRFRHYLKAAVRYSAISRLRRRPPLNADSAILAAVPDASSELELSADREWLEQWRRCVLDRVWQTLEFNEQQPGAGLSYTVLKLTSEQPDTDSASLAAEVTQRTGRSCSAEAFRKQLSRARRQFAEAIVAELRQSLASPTREALEEELIDLKLFGFVRDFL